MKITYIIAISTFLFSTCFTVQHVLPEDNSKSAVILPFSFEEIVIVDQREEKIDFPTDTKERVINYNPILKESNKNEIREIFSRSHDPNGTEVFVEYRLIKADAILDLNFSRPREYVLVNVEIHFNIPDRNYQYTSSYEMYYDDPNFGSTKEHVTKLFDLLLRNATHGMLDLLKTEVDKRDSVLSKNEH